MEGSRGVVSTALGFGVSEGTVANVFLHGVSVLHGALKNMEESLIQWLSPERRNAMFGLVMGFPYAIAFVDGTKQKTFRPGKKEEQELKYDRHHCLHAYSSLIWCEVFGKTI